LWFNKTYLACKLRNSIIIYVAFIRFFNNFLSRVLRILLYYLVFVLTSIFAVQVKFWIDVFIFSSFNFWLVGDSRYFWHNALRIIQILYVRIINHNIIFLKYLFFRRLNIVKQSRVFYNRCIQELNLKVLFRCLVSSLEKIWESIGVPTSLIGLVYNWIISCVKSVV